MKKVINQWNVLFVFLFLIDGLLRVHVPIGASIYNVVTFSLLLVMFFAVGRKDVSKETPFFPFLMPLAFVLVTETQILCLSHVQLRSNFGVLVWILALLFFSWKNTINTAFYKYTVHLFSLIGAVSALVVVGGLQPLTLADRSFLLIDKGYLTLFFALSMCMSFFDVANKKHIKTNAFIFVAIFIVNTFVVSSRTAMVALIAFVATMFFLSESRVRKMLAFFLVPILAVYCVLVVLYPEQYISHSMAVAVNQVLGDNVLRVDVDKTNLATYELRALIDARSFEIFLSSPIYGIGMGGFALMGGVDGILECENTYMDILVGGGILLGLPLFFMMIFMTILIVKNIKDNVFFYENYMALSIMLCVIICFRWNDFLLPIVFALMGCAFYIAKRTRKMGRADEK